MSGSPFPKRLKEARLRAKISQKKLGIAAGMDDFVASSRMNHYETGRHHPLFETVDELARVLGVPVSYLYEPDDEMAHIILMIGRLDLGGQMELMAWLEEKLERE